VTENNNSAGCPYSVQSGSKCYVSASIISVPFYLLYIELSQSQ